MKPMLAGKITDTSKLRYPLFASPKLDGIRCVISNRVSLSRSLKPIPNQFVQSTLETVDLSGYDGELIVGDPTADDVYRMTNSAIMSRDGEPDFGFYVFDDFTNGKKPFEERLKTLQADHPRVIIVPQMFVEREDDLLALEHHLLQEGYEGVMVRDPQGIYKHNRSTLKEGYLLKLKRFKDGEAEIIGFEEKMHNGNEAKINELGQTERSSHKAGLVPMGTLGALVVRDINTGITFNIGTGFDDADRQHIWNRQDSLHGSIIKYKSFNIGVKEKPRHPVFLGIRDKRDM